MPTIGGRYVYSGGGERGPVSKIKGVQLAKKGASGNKFSLS